MSKNVQIIFNPYQQRLRVLIDGATISAYGNLQQYMDEPFVMWCDKIMDGIRDETNGEKFYLTFTGSKEEDLVMRTLASSSDACIKYVYKEPIRNIGTAERMKNLHRLIKKYNLNGYHKQTGTIVFVLSEEFNHLKDDLLSMEVKNVFCQFTAQVISMREFANYQANDNVIIAILPIDKTTVLAKMNLHDGFAVAIDANSSAKKTFKCKSDGVFIWSANEQSIFDAIFDMLLLSPLLKVFRDCVLSFPDNIVKRYDSQFEDFLSITEKIIPIIDNNVVEVGKSNRIQFKNDIDGTIISGTKFRYSYEPEGLVVCDGFAVEGISEGKVLLNVHREGEAVPCTSLNLTVIKRNRIKQIVFEKNELILGEDHNYRLNLSYEPRDADNVQLIEWQTDNENVATVDKRGVIFAKKAGICTISCFAEKVVSRCRVTVKPMLQDIVSKEDTILLQYGETHDLNIQCLPPNSLDGQVLITSMDMRIVNVMGNKIQGIGEGTTRIVLSNQSETVRKEISVTVRPQKGKHWWSWIFNE